MQDIPHINCVADLPDFPSRVTVELTLGQHGYPSPKEIAARLGLSPRSLRRHLLAAGTNYQSLLQEVRSRDALSLLLSQDLEIRIIGEMLGYANAANFTRAFIAWTGTTPSAWRDKYIHLEQHAKAVLS